METDVLDFSYIFSERGFKKTKHGIFIKKQKNIKPVLWGLVTEDFNQSLMTLGAILPDLNVSAFKLMKQVSNNKFKPQYPVSIAPPIYIAQHKDFSAINADKKIDEYLETFLKSYSHLSEDDWCDLALRNSPQTQSSQILLPAYFSIKNDKKSFSNYLNNFVDRGENSFMTEYYHLLEGNFT